MVELDNNRIPQHIAIIMDGNGRWAKAQGKPRTAGHIQGVETVRVITEECVNLGVKYLTLYTFSNENWNRPEEEVRALMGLLLKNLEDEIFMKNNVRFRIIGDRYRLPQDVQKKISEMEQRTSKNDSMTLVLALSYSARWEIADACRQIYVDMQGVDTEKPTVGTYCVMVPQETAGQDMASVEDPRKPSQEPHGHTPHSAFRGGVYASCPCTRKLAHVSIQALARIPIQRISRIPRHG